MSLTPVVTPDSMPLDSRQTAALERATELALSYLGSLETMPVAATASLVELRRRFSRPLTDTGIDPVTVIEELARDAAGGLLGSAGGRFYGWVIGAGLPAALGADWLTAAWDQNAGFVCGSKRRGHLDRNLQRVVHTHSSTHQC